MAIGIDIEANGVNKFKQEMSQATASVKAYGAELRVCEATYQQTGDQAAYLTEKTSILRKQLDEQKRAVAAAEKALEQVTKQYGEGSKQATEWRTKLAQARATMIQTETAIKNTDAAMDALGKDDVSGVAKDLGKVGDEAKKADTAADGLAESVGGIAEVSGRYACSFHELGDKAVLLMHHSREDMLLVHRLITVSHGD